MAEEINTSSSRVNLDFPGDSYSKESACNAGDTGSMPVSDRSPGEGNGYPLQYSCLENSMGRGTLWATVHEVAKSRTRLSTNVIWSLHCIQDII